MWKQLLFLSLVPLSISCKNIEALVPPPVKILPPVVEPIPIIACADFNATNFKEELPCECPETYTLNEDGLYCIDKNELATLYIDTVDQEVIGRNTYVNGTLTIDADNFVSDWSKSYSIRVRGRGNSTWDMPKKPYRIKLDSSAKVMGMPKAKDWVLLANYADKSLIRTMIANEIGRRLGMPYTHRYRSVDLVINASYRGTYLLTEQVEIKDTRVNVVDNGIDGGYLVELDRYKDADYIFSTTREVDYSVKEPEDMDDDRKTYISSLFQEAEDALYASNFTDPVNGYRKYIDVESFVNWYLVNEIAKNSDAANYSSIYFYKSSGEKIKMGPLWDFDLSFGNINYTEAEYPQGFWIKTYSPWFSRLMEDPYFEGLVKQKWKDLRKMGLDKNSLLKFIDQKALSLANSQPDNFIKWPILDIYVWPNRVITGSYQGEIDAIKDWLSLRMDFLDGEWK